MQFPDKVIFGTLTKETILRRKAALTDFLRAVLLFPEIESSALIGSFLQQSLRPDWPSVLGVIDLKVHDAPHASSTIEWWRITGHAVSESSSQRFTVHAIIYRVAVSDRASSKPTYLHAASWSITAVERGLYIYDSVMESGVVGVLQKYVEEFKKGSDGIVDVHVSTLMDLLERGRIPEPDRVLKCRSNPENLHFDFGDVVFMKDHAARDSYILKLSHACGPEFGSASLHLEATSSTFRNGDNGIINDRGDGPMFSYFVPRCSIRGTICIKGNTSKLAKDSIGWYEHSFGGDSAVPLHKEEKYPVIKPKLPSTRFIEPKDLFDFRKDHYKSMTFIIHLSNNVELLVRFKKNRNDEVSNAFACAIEDDALLPAKSTIKRFDDVSIVEDGVWVSQRTFVRYGTAWTITIPTLGMVLSLRALIDDQEIISIVCSSWSGTSDVSAVVTGKPKPIMGRAFVIVDSNCYCLPIKTFFAGISRATSESIKRLYPESISYEQAEDMISIKRRGDHILEGVTLNSLVEIFIGQLRHYVADCSDPWRFYLLSLSADAVGGDSRPLNVFLGLPAVIDAGSIVIDRDSEGEYRSTSLSSSSHRTSLHDHDMHTYVNGPLTAHLQGQHMLRTHAKRLRIKPETILNLYDLFSTATRSKIAGDALECNDVVPMMDEASLTGDVSTLEKQLFAAIRLRDALPLGALARMGAYLGGASSDQVDALGRYAEALATAGTLMSSVVRLRGEYSEEGELLRQIGEDIEQCNITFPIIKAMEMLDSPIREAIWVIIKSKPNDIKDISDCISALEACGAIQACQEEAAEVRCSCISSLFVPTFVFCLI